MSRRVSDKFEPRLHLLLPPPPPPPSPPPQYCTALVLSTIALPQLHLLLQSADRHRPGYTLCKVAMQLSAKFHNTVQCD